MTDKEHNFAKDINVPSKEQIMINGVDVSECEYLTYQLEEDGQYYWFCNIAPVGGPDECEYKPECFYKKILKQLVRKTQECEKYKQALNEIRNIIASGDVGTRPKLYDFEQDSKILDIVSKAIGEANE